MVSKEPDHPVSERESSALLTVQFRHCTRYEHLPSSWKIYIRLNLNVIPTHPLIFAFQVAAFQQVPERVHSLVYSLLIKPTDALNSNFIGITTLHVLGSLSDRHQRFLTVHRLWYILCSCDEPFATRIKMFHPTPGSKLKYVKPRCSFTVCSPQFVAEYREWRHIDVGAISGYHCILIFVGMVYWVTLRSVQQ